MALARVGALLGRFGELFLLPFADGITFDDIDIVFLFFEVSFLNFNLNFLTTTSDVRDLFNELDGFRAGNLLVMADFLATERNPFTAALLLLAIFLRVTVDTEIDPFANTSAIGVIKTSGTGFITDGDFFDVNLDGLGDGAVLNNSTATLFLSNIFDFVANEGLLFLDPWFSAVRMGVARFG